MLKKDDLIDSSTHPSISVGRSSCMAEGMCWVLVVNLQTRMICDAPVEREIQTVHKWHPNITIRPWPSVLIIILDPDPDIAE